MLHGVVTACLQDVVEANDVGLYVDTWVCDGVPHAGLGCKVHDDVEFVLLEQAIHEPFVRNAALYEREITTQGLDFTQSVFL